MLPAMIWTIVAFLLAIVEIIITVLNVPFFEKDTPKSTDTAQIVYVIDLSILSYSDGFTNLSSCSLLIQ